MIGRPRHRSASAHKKVEVSVGRGVLMLAVSLVVASGCVTIRTDSRSMEEIQAEEQYKAVYAAHMQQVGQALGPFRPSGSDPGVCNIGGSRQGCHAADERLISAFESMIDELATIAPPPRYARAAGLLNAAIRLEILGLQTRNSAIESHDDAAWTAQNQILHDAQTAVEAAYQAFPTDNRPMPRP
jgi:hypothetical protein